MENASKALIIAGAILLSILIISLGIMVYNNAKSTVGEASLDPEKVQTFNSKFTMYAGEKVSASKANSLIQAVNASNATGENKIGIVFATSLVKNTHYVGDKTDWTFDDTNGVVTAAGSCNATLSSNYNYVVTCTNSTKTGYVYKITFEPAISSSSGSGSTTPTT